MTLSFFECYFGIKGHSSNPVQWLLITFFASQKSIEIETDYKPLVPFLGAMHLNTLPPRVLRFRLTLSGNNYTLQTSSCKLNFHTEQLKADKLSKLSSEFPAGHCAAWQGLFPQWPCQATLAVASWEDSGAKSEIHACQHGGKDFLVWWQGLISDCCPERHYP